MKLRRKCVKLRKYINYVVTNLMYAALYLNCTLSYCTSTVPVLAANSWLKIDGAEDGDDQLGPSRVVPSLHLVMMMMMRRRRIMTRMMRMIMDGEEEEVVIGEAVKYYFAIFSVKGGRGTPQFRQAFLGKMVFSALNSTKKQVF